MHEMFSSNSDSYADQFSRAIQLRNHNEITGREKEDRRCFRSSPGQVLQTQWRKKYLAPAGEPNNTYPGRKHNKGKTKTNEMAVHVEPIRARLGPLLGWSECNLSQ